MLFFASLTIPYIAPKSFPLLSILSLAVPLLLFAHVIFIVYWLLIGFKKQFLLSFLCLLLAVGLSFFPYKFKEKKVVSGSSFAVMNYNVRLFNKYQWLESEEIPVNISKFIEKQDPDIITFQEYYANKEVSLSYDHSFIKLNGGKRGSGLAIFSKLTLP